MKQEKAFKMMFEGGRDAALLEAIAEIVEKDVYVHRAGQGSAADSVKIGGKTQVMSPRLTNDSDDQVQGAWEMAYAIDDTGRVSWVWIGHKILGPCYQRGDNGRWRNCFSHGNFGKNYASGGTWSGGGGDGHETLDECIAARADDAKNLTAGYADRACLPVVPPRLADQE
jgi:hypothetical protein